MPKNFFDIIPPQKTKQELSLEPGIPLKKTGLILERKKKQALRFPSWRGGAGGDTTKLKRTFMKTLIFCLVFLILVGVFSYSVFSKVKIEIWPEIETLTLKETITIDSKIKQNNFAEKIIPGRIFKDQKSTSQEFSSSGKVLKEKKATGIIRVYNDSVVSRALIPSRFVSADGKLFWSVKRIVIPGGKYEKGKFVPGYVDVEAQAAGPGEDYNIKPSTFALPALAGSSLYTTIYGRSFLPMTGGFEGEASQVTQEDLDRAKNDLVENLKTESKDFLKTIISSDFILLDETTSQEIIEENYSVEAGAEAESFNLQVRVESTGLAFKKSDIEDFAKNLINLNIPEDKKFQEASLEINYSLKETDVLNLPSSTFQRKVELGLEVKAKIYPNIDLIELKRALSGRPFQEVEIFLEDQPQITKIEIDLGPFWRKKVPENIDKIELKLNLTPLK